MRMWHKLEQDARFAKILMGIIIVEFLIIVMLWIGWLRSPSDLIVHIPPNLESGATIKNQEMPESSLYAFSYYVWQSLNNWPTDGEKDYHQNLQSYVYLLTPRFYEQLLSNQKQLLARGELQGRIRVMHGALGAAYEQHHVKPLGKDAWEVRITMRVTEYVRGVPVKDVDIEYPLRVIRYDPNRQYNKWGLGIDGFTSEPQRVHVHDIAKTPDTGKEDAETQPNVPTPPEKEEEKK